MEIALAVVLLLIGFGMLFKGADLFIDGAVSVSRIYHISPLIIGLTVVAFGTSAPELSANFFAALKGTTDLVMGNIIGSNIANISLALGSAAIMTPVIVKSKEILRDIPTSFIATLIFFLMANDVIFGHQESVLTRGDGMIFLSLFLLFLFMTYREHKKLYKEEAQEHEEHFSGKKSSLYIILGVLGLAFGGNLIVDNALIFARYFGASDKLIGLTIIAVGTSLPELITSVVAAHKKQTEIAFGNAIGSNIFNIFFVLGVTSVVRPLPMNPALNADLILLLWMTVLLMIFVMASRKLSRWQGGVLLLIYVVYFFILFVRN